ncbi:putative alpha-L-fucosidase [Venturia nashicola]|nr:putative alpha-L-fucosidase [Venturia nashicola]
MLYLGILLVVIASNVAPSWAAGNETRAVSAKSVPIPLNSYFNNKAFGSYPGEASFDPLNQSYPVPTIARNGTYKSTKTGIKYDFPGYRGKSRLDNVLCLGQKISVAPAKYFSASMLVTSDVESATVSGNLTYHYSDNTTSTSELRSQPWFSFLTIDRGEIILPYRYTSNGTNYNTSNIFEYTGTLTPGKTLTSISLPSTANTTTGRLHVFSISLWKGSDVQIQSVRPTQKWSSNGTQIVEVTLNNAGTECVSGSGLKISIAGGDISTIDAGSLKRLCPGDQKRVDIGVIGKFKGEVTVILKAGTREQRTTFNNVDIGLKSYTSDLDSLAKHESPDWFDDAKFGIFIHWGPYAVTGWGNSSPYESYSEWFWWYSTHHPQADRSDFYDYRLRTFGRNWTYDDTFPAFTADGWDPKQWVDLFADAGAKYFVFTSKHHDGFANFNAGLTTNRSSVNYGPQRDILGELFDAAKKYQPSLKRGTYFSLPEWFNPDFGPYGFVQTPDASSVSWPGVLARNPYTGLEEPYTGRVPIKDFITDLMVPQMEILAYNYSTDIMWCDCGAANGTAPFAAAWWNKAKAQNRQVAINSRCGLAHAADFDTPEYATFRTAQRRKWESNQGMDPYSYGYNRATPNSAYMNPKTIINSLVDMVSKNGNFLLDIGPQANGKIVEAEIDNLRTAGKWIHAHEEAIFNTTYWFVQTEITSPKSIRFTQTNDAFYILFLDKPDTSGSVLVDAPVPILQGDSVTAVGLANIAPLTWSKTLNGGLNISIPATLVEAEEYCWVFKITYLS